MTDNKDKNNTENDQKYLILSDDSGQMTVMADSGEISKLLNPLISEIHLFDTYISGTSRIKDTTVFGEIKSGDELSLVRKADKFDENAIAIFTKADKKLGYVPETDNPVFARLMDAGKMLSAKITKISGSGSFPQIAIGIYLVDF